MIPIAIIRIVRDSAARTRDRDLIAGPQDTMGTRAQNRHVCWKCAYWNTERINTCYSLSLSCFLMKRAILTTIGKMYSEASSIAFGRSLIRTYKLEIRISGDDVVVRYLRLSKFIGRNFECLFGAFPIVSRLHHSCTSLRNLLRHIYVLHRLTSLLDFEDNYKMTMPCKSAFGYDPGFARKTPRNEGFFVSSRFTSKIWAPFLRRWHERCYLRSFADLFVRFRKQVQCTTGLVGRVFQTLLHSTIAHCDLHGRKIRPMVPSTLFRVILVNRDVASPRGEDFANAFAAAKRVFPLSPREFLTLTSMFLWNMH